MTRLTIETAEIGARVVMTSEDFNSRCSCKCTVGTIREKSAIGVNVEWDSGCWSWESPRGLWIKN